MTKVYLPGMTVTETVELKDLNGNSVTPSTAEYDVRDEKGIVVVEKTAVVLSGNETLVSVVVPQNINAVSSDGRSARTITLYMTTPEGVLQNFTSYFVEAAVTLIVMSNTVQTFEEAELISFDVGSMLSGWSPASRVMKISAMKTAYERIKALTFTQYNMRSIRGKTEDEFRATAPDFQKALRRAQVVEADLVLNGDQIHIKQQQGILSETIGESSMFFRTTPPLNEPLSKQAMSELRGHIDRSIIIGRG